MKGKILAVLLAAMIALIPVTALAATTQDVTVTATPSYISISNSPTSYNFNTVAASATPNTGTGYFTVTNTSSVNIEVTLGVTATTWSGGVTWTHSETATPGVDTAGLKASKNDGTYGVIVKNASPNLIATAQSGNFQWELKLYAPTSFGDGVQKSITARLTATAS